MGGGEEESPPIHESPFRQVPGFPGKSDWIEGSLVFAIMILAGSDGFPVGNKSIAIIGE